MTYMIRIIGISCIVGISGTIIIGTKICGPLGLKFGLNLWFFSLDIRFLGFGSVADSPCLDKRRIPNSHWWVLSFQKSTLPIMSWANPTIFSSETCPKPKICLKIHPSPTCGGFHTWGIPKTDGFKWKIPI